MTRSARSSDGFDGTWVAHPDLVPIATEVFDRVLGERPHQKDRRREVVAVDAGQLLDLPMPGGAVTEAGVRANVRVALAYLDCWLRGNGAAAIDNLMEDAATAEIARSQLWYWRIAWYPPRRRPDVDAELYRRIRDEELARLGGPASGAAGGGRRAARPARPRRRLRRVPDPARVFVARVSGAAGASGGEPDGSCPATPLDECPHRGSDERPGADDRPSPDEDVAHGALDRDALVRRVVARVVEVRGADRPPGGRVEQDEVGVPADLERALAREPEPTGRRRGQQVDHPLDGEPTARDALPVEERQQGLDAGGAVADPVERDAPGRLGLLDGEAVRDVVGGDQIERAVGQARPQRVAVGRRPERRRDDVAGARRPGRGRRSARRSGRGSAGRSRPRRGRRPPWPDGPRSSAVGRREVDDVDRGVGHPGERQRPGRRDGLDVAGRVVAW